MDDARQNFLKDSVGVAVGLHVFLISIVDTRNRSSSRPSRLISWEASSMYVASRVSGQLNPCWPEIKQKKISATSVDQISTSRSPAR